jgi:hypothetical protein
MGVADRIAPWREGVATGGPSEPQKWAWVVAWLTLGIGSTLAGIGRSESAWVSAGMAVGFAGGVAWQWLYRRDLAERLWLYSWLLVVGALVLLIPGTEYTGEGAEGPLMLAAQIAGLVLGEQWLRRHERSAGRD